MTAPVRAGNNTHFHLGACLAAGVLVIALGCAESATVPRAEFIVSGGDSTYWVQSDGKGIRVRGTPMVVARLDDRFRELYVVDDDHSYEGALFVGQRLYQRDLVTGDSTEIFRDTLVPALARRFAREHPDARALEPDEDPGEEPEITATAELSVIGVHGPYLSLEYHADTTGRTDDVWHMTRHIVVDLRSGQQVDLDDVVGAEQAKAALARGRALYQETVDSIRRDQRPEARRASQSLGSFRFDPRSFALTAPNGTLMIAFSAPGQGHGGEGFVMPMRPIGIVEPAWWAAVRDALPSSTGEREERWARPGYAVRVVYDTSGPAQLTIADSAGREFAAGPVSAPVHRIYWLDRPAITKAQRDALVKAFDEAAMYDDAARTALGPRGGRRPLLRLAAR